MTRYHTCDLKINQVTGISLVKITWEAPEGSGCTLPSELVRAVDNAIRTSLVDIKISGAWMNDIKIQAEPIWTDPMDADSLLNDESHLTLFEDSLRCDKAIREALQEIIDMFGEEELVDALKRRGYDISVR